MVEIVQKESANLREKSRELKAEEISSPKIRKIIKSMKDALDSQEDGVAIAAPQIGENLRIFVVSKRIHEMERIVRNPSPEDVPSVPTEREDMVFINPKIIKSSREKKMMEEGCLSIRWLYGKVKRSTKVSLEALDEAGNSIERGASGLLAQVFQHELDHLNGILFIDKAIEVREMLPETENA